MQFLQTYFINPVTKDIFDYKTHTSKKDYWFSMLCFAVVYALLAFSKFLVSANSVEITDFQDIIFGAFYIFVVLAIVLANISIKMRRLRDAGFNHNLAFLALIPYVGELALIVFMLKPSAGEPPQEPEFVPINMFTFFVAAVIAFLMFWDMSLLYKAVKRAQKPWFENRALMEAVEKDSPSDLKKVLNPFIRLEVRDRDNNTALIYAVRKHPSKDFIKPFIRLKAKVNATLPNGDTPLYIAIAKRADLPTLEYLIDKGAKVNTENTKNITPLMVAAKRGNEKTTALLLLHGAAPLNSKGKTILQWTVPVNPVTRALLELALAKDKQQKFKDKIYEDVLKDKDISDRLPGIPKEWKNAAAAGTMDFMADKNSAGELIGDVSDAFKEADASWAQKMVDKGLSMGKISDGGQTALMYAAMLSSNTEVLDVFIKSGANVNAKDKDGISVLTWAAAVNPNPDITAYLVEKDADVNAVTDKNVSVLDYAAIQSQNPQIIDLLIEHGADVNYQGAGGGTPLIYAALNNSNPEVVETLIKNGADVKAKDAGGMAVINYASMNKNPKVLSVIRDYLIK